MARKEIDIRITEDGRDKGKTFHLLEMDADQAEWWAIRVISALVRANPELATSYAEGAGMAALAMAGVKALMLLDPIDAKPLLDQMMTCVSIKPDPKNPNIVRQLLPNDIEEVRTRLQLRSEVFALHTGFSIPGSR